MTKIFPYVMIYLTSIVSCWAMTEEASEVSTENKLSVNARGEPVESNPEGDVVYLPVAQDDESTSQSPDLNSVVNFNANPVTNSVVPSGVSLQEFLEFGMVPVEDLEAELASPVKNGLFPTGPSGKYYTVYTRAIGTGGLVGDSGEADAAEEDEDEDPEDEDDDPENVNL